jgi:hypothetical protein
MFLIILMEHGITSVRFKGSYGEKLLIWNSKMDAHKVWHVNKRKEMPEGKKCIKCKWVLDIKRNGIFRARLVACGYSQIPGQDFTNAYSPAMNDITIHIMLLTKLVHNLESKLADVETAFLYGILEELIFMECPEGLSIKDDEVVQLDRTIYGLVQEVRAFFNRLKLALGKIGFIQSLMDPCLFILKKEEQRVISQCG